MRYYDIGHIKQKCHIAFGISVTHKQFFFSLFLSNLNKPVWKDVFDFQFLVVFLNAQALRRHVYSVMIF